MRQFKGSDWVLNDQLTMEPENIKKSVTCVRAFFQKMISNMQQQANQSGTQPARPGQQPPAGPQSNGAPLNATNLQQLQQQQEAIHRKRMQSQPVPAAPTATQPPFPIGAASPSGIPQAYGPGGFSPEKLKIPPSKRRKQSQAGVPTPTSATATPIKTEPSKPLPVTGVKTFPCPLQDCDYHLKGFPTQVALDKHTEQSHKPEEPIEDALKYALDSFQASLTASARYKAEKEASQKPAAGDGPKGPVKATPVAALKQEHKAEGGTPSASGATPMARVSSQAGAKSSSPASTQLPTPRAAAGKVPTSAALKTSPSKDGRKETEKAAEPSTMAEDALMTDSWADSLISLDAIHETFIDLGEDSLPVFGLDPIDEFLNSEMFTSKGQTEDTPDSVETGVVTQTPKDGEASKEQESSLKISGLNDEDWLPVNWTNHPGQYENDLLMNDQVWEDINWDTIDPKEAEMSVDDMNFFSLPQIS
jgi:hypothetical protein